MIENTENRFVYKFGFVIALVLLWTLACMSAGFVTGTIFGRPTMRIENYNAEGFMMADAINTQPVTIPDVHVAKRRKR